MKTARKSKNRAQKAAVSTPALRIAGTKAGVLLAGRWVADTDDRIALSALTGALSQVGIAAQLWRPFEDSLAETRCLHLFGTVPEFLPVVESARRNRVKVLLTPETWQADAQPGPYPRGWLRKSAVWFAKTGRGVFNRTPAWQRELYASVDLLLPNSNLEAQQIARRFKLPMDHLSVIPHGVDPHFAAADPGLFRRFAGISDFVLYVGSIEPNNQQLGFLWAMKNMEVPVVILGDVAPQCEWYLDECRRVAGENVQFRPRLAANDPRLASAYAGCACLVVGNTVPAPERIALAAAASGTPVVLFEGCSGKEYFGQQAFYVRPDDVAGIHRGVEAALDRKRSKNLAEHVTTYFSWKAVARTLRDTYCQAWRDPHKGL